MIPENLTQIRIPRMNVLETIETLENMGQGHFLTMGPDKRLSKKWESFLGVAFFLRIEMIKNRHCS